MSNAKVNANTNTSILLIIAPFALGVIWILCHPLISIVTGELKCRGVYIDEHQLDPNSYSIDKHSSLESTGLGAGIGAGATMDEYEYEYGHEYENDFDVCQFIERIKTSSSTSSNSKSNGNSNSHNILSSSPLQSVSCHSHTHHKNAKMTFNKYKYKYKNSFQILKIDPVMSFAPTSPLESIVFVIPPPLIPITTTNTTTTSSSSSPTSTPSYQHQYQFHLQKAILNMIARIVKYSSPYLAKTVLFVFSVNNDYEQYNNNNINNNNKNSSSTSNGELQHAALEQTVQELFNAMTMRIESTNNLHSTHSHDVNTFEFNKYIMRQLIVLDIEQIQTPIVKPPPSSTSKSSTSTVESTMQIIPHGTYGQLPNLDFITAALYSFQRFPFINNINTTNTNRNAKRTRISTTGMNSVTPQSFIQMHTYHQFTSWIQQYIHRTTSATTSTSTHSSNSVRNTNTGSTSNYKYLDFWKQYVTDLVYMVSFMTQAIFK